ncbi:hypothetical protein DFH07DRAFT_971492 [Mycena maculata]|uniref:Secreted protein n=1 Tax=Mycena maculata TaxID=230809 RepID=A0AAD7MN16_9AGAR|nr:hypothetical protein DFH07DRAFT_971492 [Mycena maculata]
MSFFRIPLRLYLFLHAIMVNPLDLDHRLNLQRISHLLKSPAPPTPTSARTCFLGLSSAGPPSLTPPQVPGTCVNQQCMTVRVAVVETQL